jgi:hypothetical protein
MHQLQALALTLTIELPVMLLLVRTIPTKKLLIVAVGASTLTHPIAWRIASVLSPAEYSVGIWFIEAGVVFVEALWYLIWLRIGLINSFRCSLLANAASFGIGWLIFTT